MDFLKKTQNTQQITSSKTKQQSTTCRGYPAGGTPIKNGGEKMEKIDNKQLIEWAVEITKAQFSNNSMNPQTDISAVGNFIENAYFKLLELSKMPKE